MIEALEITLRGFLCYTNNWENSKIMQVIHETI